jgi:hypothetical protein
MSGRPQGPYAVKNRSPVVTTGFQHIHKAHQVGLRIRMRVGDGVTRPGLRRQVHHTIKLLGLAQGRRPRR